PWAEDSEDRQSEGVSIERLGLRKVFGSQQRSATENLHAKSPVRYNRGQPWCSKFWKPRDCHFRRRRAQHKCGTHRQLRSAQFSCGSESSNPHAQLTYANWFRRERSSYA